MECLLCKGKSQNTIPLCPPCQKDLPWHPADNIGFYYQHPIDQWISLLKFHQKLQYAHVLGHLFAYKLRKRIYLPELIIPIPLHTRRLCRRGFNQALEIVKPMSRRLKIPIDRRSLKRIRHTQAQSELVESDRHSNMRNAFHLVKHIKEKHITLFDDVMTTGSTINAALKALENRDFQRIEYWCLAKTKR